jgi:predicted MFS family arabinose efflux permease
MLSVRIAFNTMRGSRCSVNEVFMPESEVRVEAADHSVSIATLTPVFAAACGCTIANLYLAQPLVGIIGQSLHLPLPVLGVTVTITQIGYGLALLLLVPLGDLVENRRLVVNTLRALTLVLLLVAFAPNAAAFMFAALMVGIGASATQMLIPIAAHLSDDESRGRVIGKVMSGLLIGVLLSRPVASLIAAAAGWRAVFAAWAALMLVLSFVLQHLLPVRRPPPQRGYLALLHSLWELFRDEPALRVRAWYQAIAYGAFSLFWTAVPLRLAQAPFHFDQVRIALFALAGVAGAVIAPAAGKAGDKGWSFPATGLALALIAPAFALASPGGLSIARLVAAAIVLDLGVWSAQVLGQRTIYALRPDARSRLNGLFISVFFVGGAVGSASAGAGFERGGWTAVVHLGMGAGALGVLSWLGEWAMRRRRTRAVLS